MAFCEGGDLATQADWWIPERDHCHPGDHLYHLFNLVLPKHRSASPISGFRLCTLQALNWLEANSVVALLACQKRLQPLSIRQISSARDAQRRIAEPQVLRWMTQVDRLQTTVMTPMSPVCENK